MLRLLKLKYPQISSTINVPNNSVLETENSVATNVQYNDDRKRILVTLQAYSKCKDHPDWFNIEVEIVGMFEAELLDTDNKIREAHVQGYDMLFPFLQALIAELTSKAGIPPYFFDKPPVDFPDIKVKAPQKN